MSQPNLINDLLKALLTLLIVITVVLAIKIGMIQINPDRLIDSLYASVGRPSCRNCNVVLVSLDTFGADHLSCYGYTKNTTPHLCAFAQNNIYFRNMYANSNFTLPGHVSLFTGLVPRVHGVNRPSVDTLKNNLPFLPQLFQKSGYETNFFMHDKQHMPIKGVYDRGIDNMNIIYSIDEWSRGLNKLRDNAFRKQKTFLFLFNDGAHLPYRIADSDRKSHSPYVDEINETQFFDPQLVVTTEFFDFYVRRLENDIRNNYWGAESHTKYAAILNAAKLNRDPDEKIAYLNSIRSNPKTSDFLEGYMFAYYLTTLDPKNNNVRKHLTSNYDKMFSYVDSKVKMVLDIANDPLLKDNTMIIVTSDHGDEFGEHGYFNHAESMYNSELRVPLIMYIPGSSKKVYTQLAQTIDIAPTLLSVVGIRSPEKHSGSSLFDNQSTQKRVISENLEDKQNIYGAIQSAEWKMMYKIVNKKIIPVELYNLSKDPHEINNLILSEWNIMQSMKKDITSFSQRYPL